MVLVNRKTRKSGRLLNEALNAEGYEGLPINYGCSFLNYSGEVLNKPEAVANAVDKFRALQILEENDIPTPLITEDEALELLNEGERVVGRKTFHSKGRGFWLFRYPHRLQRAKRLGCTHFLRYIEDPLEFRVHIANGKSIKVSEKIRPVGVIKASHSLGTTFEYPQSFNHKKTLRRLSKMAQEALSLDFCAIDILWKNDEFYILEVNSAPSLTDPTSDTLERYVEAFLTLF